jgi:hypothetical protein
MCQEQSRKGGIVVFPWVIRYSRLSLAVVVLGAVALAAGCGKKGEEAKEHAQHAGEEAGAAAKDAAQQVGDAARTSAVKDDLATDAFVANFKTELAQLDSAQQDLRARAAKLGGQSEVAAEKRLAELNAERERLMKATEALKTKAGARADSARADLEKSMVKLKRAYAAAATELKK